MLLCSSSQAFLLLSLLCLTTGTARNASQSNGTTILPGKGSTNSNENDAKTNTKDNSPDSFVPPPENGLAENESRRGSWPGSGSDCSSDDDEDLRAMRSTRRRFPRLSMRGQTAIPIKEEGNTHGSF